MAQTSGTATFNLQLTELCEEAFERAGQEMRSGYDLRTARRSLNIMFADWANRGINMWTIDQGTITLTPGLNTYALPLDTVDLLDHVIRTQSNNTANQSDLTITRISVSTYATLPNKLQQSRPIQVWVQRLNGQNLPTGYTVASSVASTDTTITLSSTANLPSTGLCSSTVRRYGINTSTAIFFLDVSVDKITQLRRPIQLERRLVNKAYPP